MYKPSGNLRRDYERLSGEYIVVLQIKRVSDWQIILAEKESIINFPSHYKDTILHIIRDEKYPHAN